MMNRFKGLDLIDRVPEELWTEIPNNVQEVVTKIIPKKKKYVGRFGRMALKHVKYHVWNELCFLIHCLSSVQFSCSVMSDSLQPHGLQHARLPCSSLTPRACSNLCPLSQWCHPNISSSVIPFSSCLQSFPASGSFPMSQFFTSGGQSIGASALASVLPVKIQDWFPLGFDMVWSPCSPRDSQESSPTPQFKSPNMLSRFVKAFLPKSKHLLISWR